MNLSYKDITADQELFIHKKLIDWFPTATGEFQHPVFSGITLYQSEQSGKWIVKISDKQYMTGVFDGSFMDLPEWMIHNGDADDFRSAVHRMYAICNLISDRNTTVRYSKKTDKRLSSWRPQSFFTFDSYNFVNPNAVKKGEFILPGLLHQGQTTIVGHADRAAWWLKELLCGLTVGKYRGRNVQGYNGRSAVIRIGKNRVSPRLKGIEERHPAIHSPKNLLKAILDLERLILEKKWGVVVLYNLIESMDFPVNDGRWAFLIGRYLKLVARRTGAAILVMEPVNMYFRDRGNLHHISGHGDFLNEFSFGIMLRQRFYLEKSNIKWVELWKSRIRKTVKENQVKSNNFKPKLKNPSNSKESTVSLSKKTYIKVTEKRNSKEREKTKIMRVRVRRHVMAKTVSQTGQDLIAHLFREYNKIADEMRKIEPTGFKAKMRALSGELKRKKKEVEKTGAFTMAEGDLITHDGMVEKEAVLKEHKQEQDEKFEEQQERELSGREKFNNILEEIKNICPDRHGFLLDALAAKLRGPQVYSYIWARLFIEKSSPPPEHEYRNELHIALEFANAFTTELKKDVLCLWSMNDIYDWVEHHIRKYDRSDLILRDVKTPRYKFKDGEIYPPPDYYANKKITEIVTGFWLKEKKKT